MVDMAESLLGVPAFWFACTVEWFFWFSIMIPYTVMVASFTFPLLRYRDNNSYTNLESDYYRIFVAALILIVIPTMLLKVTSICKIKIKPQMRI